MEECVAVETTFECDVIPLSVRCSGHLLASVDDESVAVRFSEGYVGASRNVRVMFERDLSLPR